MNRSWREMAQFCTCHVLQTRVGNKHLSRVWLFGCKLNSVCSNVTKYMIKFVFNKKLFPYLQAFRSFLFLDRLERSLWLWGRGLASYQTMYLSFGLTFWGMFTMCHNELWVAFQRTSWKISWFKFLLLWTLNLQIRGTAMTTTLVLLMQVVSLSVREK